MKKWIALVFLALPGGLSLACSGFLLKKNGQYVFGRNYDWVTGNGAVMINSRGEQKKSFIPLAAKTISWTSKWGSISFNQFGKQFPHGGMNEKGLVVELMWLSETSYPKPDNRAALNELQWIQYQLDNCTTVEEVIATDAIVRIARENAAPLHYLVADANGHAATIEFINGKMVVHTGKDLTYPVLTNTVYTDALQQASKKNITDNSVARFATACEMVQSFENSTIKENSIDASFAILNKIAQGDFTKWRIAYDISNRSVYFVTRDFRKRKKISFSKINFSCTGKNIFLDINNQFSGDVSQRFSDLSFDQNKTIMQRSATESKNEIEIPNSIIDAAAAYYRQVSCK